MDKLQERAFSFRHLLDFEYKIKIGRKGKITELTIDFERSDFFHLIGLHKLTDVVSGNMATAKLFDDCTKGNLSYSTIEKKSLLR